MSTDNKDPLLGDRRGLSRSVSCLTFGPRHAFHTQDQIPFIRGTEMHLITVGEQEHECNYPNDDDELQ